MRVCRRDDEKEAKLKRTPALYDALIIPFLCEILTCLCA